MKKKLLALPFILSIIFFVSSCDKADPEIINPEELITTLNLVLTPDGGGTAVTLTFHDLDGDGGNSPVITGGTFAANTQYTGALTLLNELETPAELINEEIEEEDDEHQFFFQALNGLNATFGYGDSDDDGNPIGLAMTLETGAASTGILKVTLRHMPVKTNPGVSDGDITNADGTTDLEVDFSVEIQ